jgi:hypothetical protein
MKRYIINYSVMKNGQVVSDTLFSHADTEAEAYKIVMQNLRAWYDNFMGDCYLTRLVTVSFEDIEGVVEKAAPEWQAKPAGPPSLERRLHLWERAVPGFIGQPPHNIETLLGERDLLLNVLHDIANHLPAGKEQDACQKFLNAYYEALPYVANERQALEDWARSILGQTSEE